MTEHPSVTDWITAAATGATAIATTIAGFIAWLAFRRDSRNQLPIIEADFGFEWPYRVLNLIIRNRLPETIVVTSDLPLLLPKRMVDTLIGRQLGLKRTRQQT